ncbi:MAG: hypothetical protein GF418_01645 [Chitinivibrionales bacterium]|nr:hypothetical protein [Chitinivibrionales bacterium]MBD3394305.1 hypothetical protein [Chitinivibrionales bacterium]
MEMLAGGSPGTVHFSRDGSNPLSAARHEPARCIMSTINPIAAFGVPQGVKPGNGKVADAGKSTAAQGKGELVEISQTSSELKSVKDAVDALPDVRLDKVEEIRAKIKINDYPIENNLDAALKEIWQANLV